MHAKRVCDGAPPAAPRNVRARASNVCVANVSDYGGREFAVCLVCVWRVCVCVCAVVCVCGAIACVMLKVFSVEPYMLT